MRRAGQVLFGIVRHKQSARASAKPEIASSLACSSFDGHSTPLCKQYSNCSSGAAAGYHSAIHATTRQQSSTHRPTRQRLVNNNAAFQHYQGFSSSAASSSSSTTDDSSRGSSSGSPTTLQASMDKLVDTAVNLVEEGKLQQAIEVLQQGVQLLESTFPGSPELSELHNQAALLLMFAHQHEPAAKHATDALDITQRYFGPTHPLTGHRLLRLASIRVAAGQLQEAQPLLAAAADMLSSNQKMADDPTLSEALYYLNILGLSAADSPSAVAALTAGLQEPFKHLVSTLGGESMIVRLALSAHSQQVGRLLDQGLPVGEAAFKQHIALQEIQDPNSAELGLTLYQVATTYYAHDMLTDAGPALQRASAILRQHYPPDHDLVILCKHRLGMICAAGRDYKSATVLLGDTWQHYSKQQEGHPLAHEAKLGLAMARVKGLDPRLSSTERDNKIREELQLMRSDIAGMAAVLGAEHLLVTAASRYLAQLAVMTGQSVPSST